MFWYKKTYFLEIWYTISPYERKEVTYFVSKYRDGSDNFYLQRQIRVFGTSTVPTFNDVIISHIEDFQVILKDKDGNVILDQDYYISTLRPMISAELTGAAPTAGATKSVGDQFVSLRGSIAYITLTQHCIQVYVVAFQRIQWPTNLDVRILNALPASCRSNRPNWYSLP